MKSVSRGGVSSYLLCAIYGFGLAACGGGGDGTGNTTGPFTPIAMPSLGIAPASTAATTSTTPAPTPIVSGKAEGAYEGTTNHNQIFQGVILENDEAYVLYGLEANGVMLVQGFLHATNGKSQSGTYTAEVTDFPTSGNVYKGSLTGTYKPKESIEGTATTAATTTTFKGSASKAANYNYDTPALLSSVAGSWSSGTLFLDP